MLRKVTLLVVNLAIVYAVPAGRAGSGENSKPNPLQARQSPNLVAQLGHSSAITSVAISPDGQQVLTGGSDETARLWEAASGKELRRFLGHTGWVKSVAFSPDGQQVLTGSWDKTARLWEAASGKELRRFLGHTHFVVSVAFSPDGQQVLTGSKDATARLWEAASGKELRRFLGHTGWANAVAFAPNGKVAAMGLGGSTLLWDTTTGRELCSLLSFDDGTWAVVDPAGRFDAANGGDVEGLHWVVGDEAIALSQLKERYYDPGLLAKYLGFNTEPIRNVEAFRHVGLFPTVAAQSPARGGHQLTLTLTNRGGGIGKVQVFVNGRELLADARGPRPDPDVATAGLTVDLAGATVLPGEPNRVRIVTWNAEGYLSSRGLEFLWEAPGRKQAQPIDLYAIVAGVSAYDGDALKLRYAAKDAEDMATALELGGRRLFEAAGGKLHLTRLCDAGHAQALPPTRANFEKAFAAARRARPGDIFVVYLAGHGVALQSDNTEVYCYLTSEARTANRAAFRDKAVRRQYALSSEELTEWFKQVPALKQVLILDTCAAGAAARNLMDHRELSADQVRAIDRMRDRTGFHVLMGCAADRVSYEASQYSQGLLTYSLLQGMRGAALRQGEYVDVSQLFQYAADEVPQLARNIGGIQRPLVLAPRATSFDVGQLRADDRQRIPLALVRPLLLRPVLLNAEALDDNLGLMPLLQQRLVEESYVPRGSREKPPRVVYVDANALPGAARPFGKYTVAGKNVQVTLVLRRDGQPVGPPLQVEGVSDELPALVSRLAAAIMDQLQAR
jgi:hypothetical protein